MSRIRILVLESNDLSISRIIKNLENNNFIVDICINNDKFLEKIYKNLYDLYIFNIDETLNNRFQLIKMLNSYQDLTMKMVITSIQSIVKLSYLSGCDECVIKTINETEIILRIKTLIRRQFRVYTDTIYLTKNIEYEIFNKRVLINKKDIFLGKKATLILEYLLKFRGSFVSTDSLEKGVYPANSDSKNGVIRFYIHQLRQVIGDNLIVSHRTYGYKIDI
ncbi:response regulator transcription factor [Aliarcobacter vitoriensis]|uniref:Helix-turn-helix domain-containing protein n=2 Tax=Aliarcobacter TaxID=2321111 RepID=A0A366MTN8_9BACT|nr:winged helix-turn-helix domain-containing protein [Aliarcobacter vitoriensis]RBQ29626.1 helix-turn-helix domain-containing protein [Aliarcobacter vitoriensis]